MKHRKALIIGGLILALILAMPLLLKGYYFVTAPKFSAIKYVSTKADYGCLAVITDATCETLYKYEVQGKEKGIAQNIINEMDKRGYKITSDSGKYSISCGLAAGNESDQYVFTKEGGSSKAQKLYMNFSSNTIPSDFTGDGISKVGCSDLEAVYDIEVTVKKN